MSHFKMSINDTVEMVSYDSTIQINVMPYSEQMATYGYRLNSQHHLSHPTCQLYNPRAQVL